MFSKVRIGSRESKLALYQAGLVQRAVGEQDMQDELIPISSEGDVDLVTPLYEMGIQGIFTKSLDAALLSNRIDLAVHSAKDIPTKLAQGLVIGAILERGDVTDSLVLNPERSVDFDALCTIATGSIRRRTQWLHRYPGHTLPNLRGNIQTRLKKLSEAGWDGVIMASAALQRLEMDSLSVVKLDWMLPAPAQGAIAVVCREDDEAMRTLCMTLNHAPSYRCVSIERDFMRELQGGCSVPIGAWATEEAERLHVQGLISSMDAKNKCGIDMFFEKTDVEKAGILAAHKIRAQGGDEILATFRKEND